MPSEAGQLIDPAGLTAAQRAGEACVSCHKKWPRPTALAGHLADGQPLYRCDDCVVVTEPVGNVTSAIRRGTRA